MAQQNIKTKLAKTRVGLETTFASTPGTIYDAIPKVGTVSMDLTQTEVENEDESVKLYDRKNQVFGLKGGSVKFDMYLKPSLLLLTGSNAPTSNYVQQILEAVFGGKRVQSGSLVGLGASTTSVPVDDASLRLSKGQWAIFSGSTGYEPAYVTNVSAGAATVIPALSAIPASGSRMANGFTFYPTETNSNSLSIYHAKVDDSNFQWLTNGCIPKSIDIKAERDSAVEMSCEFDVATWSTGSLGVTSTIVTETQTSPFVLRDAVVILQPTSTTTRTHVPLESFAIKLNTGMEFVPDVGSTEGKVGVMRVGERLFAEATLKLRADTRQDYDWAAQTDLQFHLMMPKVDANNVKSWLVVSLPTCTIVGKPKWSDTSGRLTCEIVLQSKLNGLVSSPSDDLGYSPFSLFLS